MSATASRIVTFWIALGACATPVVLLGWRALVGYICGWIWFGVHEWRRSWRR